MMSPNMHRSRLATGLLLIASLLAACTGSASPPATRGGDGATALSSGSAPSGSAPSGSAPSGSAPSGSAAVGGPSASAGAERTFRAEVWADNWFALYVNGRKVGEDTVPITTERSFNAETITFTATYPLTIAMVTRDYLQTDSGLEYIGTSRQQMGDGGFIAQVWDVALGRVVAATGPGWRGLVIQRAPLNTDCEKAADPATACRFASLPEPAGWQAPGFDDSGWAAASVYTAAQVGTKEGYDTIRWDAAARLIWGSDLKVDNVILWRWTATAPA